MANRGLFTLLIVMLGLGILFAGGLNIGYENATTNFSVTNESITVNYTDAVFVDEPDTDTVTYNATVDVYNASGVELVDGTDYEWHPANGSVTWYDTASTVSGETATISYQYAAPPESNRAMFGALEIISIGLVLIVILLAAQWLFEVVGDW